MTSIEKFELIKETMAENEEIVKFCDSQIASIQKKAAKAKERAASQEKEPDELMAAVREALTTEFETKEAIAAKIEGEDVSVGKVVNRLSKLAASGEVVKEKTKSNGKEITMYKLAAGE